MTVGRHSSFPVGEMISDGVRCVSVDDDITLKDGRAGIVVYIV